MQLIDYSQVELALDTIPGAPNSRLKYALPTALWACLPVAAQCRENLDLESSKYINFVLHKVKPTFAPIQYVEWTIEV